MVPSMAGKTPTKTPADAAATTAWVSAAAAHIAAEMERVRKAVPAGATAAEIARLVGKTKVDGQMGFYHRGRQNGLSLPLTLPQGPNIGKKRPNLWVLMDALDDGDRASGGVMAGVQFNDERGDADVPALEALSHAIQALWEPVFGPALVTSKPSNKKVHVIRFPDAEQQQGLEVHAEGGFTYGITGFKFAIVPVT